MDNQNQQNMSMNGGQPIQPTPQPVMGQPAPVAPQSSEDKTKGIGIGALICAFLVPTVGLILGIVGLVMSSKIKKQTGMKAQGQTLSLVATIVSVVWGIVAIILLVVLFVGGVFSILDSNKQDLIGDWRCTDRDGDVYSITFDRNDRYSIDRNWVSTGQRDSASGKFSVPSVSVVNSTKTITTRLDGVGTQLSLGSDNLDIVFRGGNKAEFETMMGFYRIVCNKQ